MYVEYTCDKRLNPLLESKVPNSVCSDSNSVNFKLLEKDKSEQRFTYLLLETDH